MHSVLRTLVPITLLLSLVGLGACSSKPARNPAALDQVQEGVNDKLQMLHSFPHTEEWESHETELNQHTFMQLGNEGKFGYHVSLLNTNHQHQVIVASELELKDAKTGKKPLNVVKELSKPAANGYFTLLTDPPRFSLIEIRDKRKTVIPVDLYDGIIGIDNQKKLNPNGIYTIKKILFKTQMQPEDKPVDESHYLVVGNPDENTAQSKYFIIHLMWGGSTYDQVMEVELDQPMVIKNAQILKLARPDSEPLPMQAGGAFEGKLVVDAQPVNGKLVVDDKLVKFKVVRQIHFRFL